MTPAPPRPEASAGAPFAIVLRGALAPSAAAGVVAAIAMVVWRGSSASAGAAIGLALGLGFFTSGLAMLSKLVRNRNPMTFMAVAMAIYLAQVIVLLGFLIAFFEAAWLDGVAFGIVVLVITVAWQIFLFRAWRRARLPVYDETFDTGAAGRPDQPGHLS
jgi:ATP synthase protein I